MISLPFPPALLSGHANGNSAWKKIAATKEHRQWAYAATLAAMPVLAAEWDIPVHVRFVPPNRRSDRVNMPNRMKPYFDGIADALGVNDVRFVPSYEFCEPEKPGRVEVFIPITTPENRACVACGCACGGVEKLCLATVVVTPREANHNAIRSSADGS